MALSIGTVLENRYRIDALLGQGGMGAVYCATHLSLNQFFAVKENSLASPASARQFQREAQMMAHLRHANLPRVTDHFVLPDGAQYLVMEYIEGEDLGQVLQRTGPIDETHALAWIGQVCDALGYLHSQQPPIIHRDIKPGNIKITPQGQVFLVDFGIAKIGDIRARTRTGALGVTPGYSPPEQHGSGGTDARSDIYALAATLYTLVTGHVPPDGVQRSIKVETLTPPRQLRPDLSLPVASAISAALSTSPTDRPPTVGAFRTLLGRRAGEVSGSTSSSPSQPRRPDEGHPPSQEVAPPFRSRRRVPGWIWGVGGVAALLLCGLFAVVLYVVWRSSIDAAPDLPATPMPSPDLAEDTVTPVPAIEVSAETPATPTHTPTPTGTPTPTPTATPSLRDYEQGLSAKLRHREENGDVIFAYPVAAPPTIDGQLGEWYDFEPHRDRRYGMFHEICDAEAEEYCGNRTGGDDLSGRFFIAWDTANLYLGIEVTDDVHVQVQGGRLLWRGDGIEIKIDADLLGDWGDEELNNDDGQLGLSPGDFASLPPGGFIWLPSEEPGTMISVAARKIGEGYTLEAAIPWWVLGGRPDPETAVGFALSLYDNDAPGTSQLQSMVCTSPERKWGSPASWGTMILGVWGE